MEVTTIWAMLSVSIVQLKLEELVNHLAYLGFTMALEQTFAAQNSTSVSQFLWFNSLTASHAGVYVCNASLAPTTGSEQTNITLQCKIINLYMY